MKAKIIRSGDKNFEEEKSKMLEIPTSDMQEAKKGLTKEDQLKLAFKKILDNYITELFCDIPIDDIVKELLTEVKIRVKL